MIRGTTPTHAFTLPIDIGMIQTVEIVYAQNGERKLEKTLTDCTVDGNTLSYTLTQEESFAFSSDAHVEIQLRVLTLGGEVLASRVMRVNISKCLSDEVLA